MLSLDINSVSVSYSGLPTPVLDIASLSIEAGSRVAITGASGSGKSTLVHILTGLERCADGGSIRWGGVDIAEMSERSRDRWRGAHTSRHAGFPSLPGLERRR